jgi:hypothetical protein
MAIMNPVPLLPYIAITNEYTAAIILQDIANNGVKATIECYYL